MKHLVMKHWCIVLMVCLLIVISGNAVGHVVASDSQLLLKSERDIIELFKSKGSWLRMVLFFSRDTSTNNETDLEHSSGSSPESALTSVDTTASSGGKPSDPVTTTQASTMVPKPTTLKTPTATMKPTTPGPLKKCQTNFTLVGDQCYYISSSIASWHNALEACQDLGSELAHPMNSKENSLLTTYLTNNHKDIPNWWIGGTDEQEEGKWVWSHDNSTLSFTDWFKGEPNGQSSENCAHIRPGYKWNDIRCNIEFNFICQKLAL